MCGRYALGIRASFVRHQLQEHGMRVDDAPEDEEARETYNFPPGAYGLVYRADVPDQGAPTDDESAPDASETRPESGVSSVPKTYNYHIKVMKWGLIPFWTKRSPDYGSLMKTINCRDDSLIDDRGMWTSMKRKKRCIVVAQGFYEWLKKGPGGKEKIPHFVKRKDGQLMCFAGLWDCVNYEDSGEKLYTYTVITTDSNKQLSFLHDRMPVILDPGTDAVKIWLDPTRNKWSKELQSLLKPFDRELECYPVNKEVGKVGNNSPDFILPVDSKENKKNIANFFGNAQKMQGSKELMAVKEEKDVESKVTENNAPIPLPSSQEAKSQKREREQEEEIPVKQQKFSPSPAKSASPAKPTTGKKPRSATSNEAVALKGSSPKKSGAGNQRITNFFAK